MLNDMMKSHDDCRLSYMRLAVAMVLTLVAAFFGWRGWTKATTPQAVQGELAGYVRHFVVSKPIEQVRLGDRVPGANPELTAADQVEDVDPETWCHVTLDLEFEADSYVAIELLRPVAWLEQNDAAIGSMIELELEEIGLYGAARVRTIGPCPEINSGPGSVVTGTFNHPTEGNLIKLWLEGLAEPIVVTEQHLFWSEDRQTFGPIRAFQAGERLRGTHGETRVARIERHSTPEVVYNLEVHGQHVYQVTSLGVLVHNCSVPLKARGKFGSIFSKDMIKQLDGASRTLRKLRDRVRQASRTITEGSGATTYWRKFGRKAKTAGSGNIAFAIVEITDRTGKVHAFRIDAFSGIYDVPGYAGKNLKIRRIDPKTGKPVEFRFDLEEQRAGNLAPDEVLSGRRADTEYKILNDIFDTDNPEAITRGHFGDISQAQRVRVAIVTERAACSSCSRAIDNFQKALWSRNIDTQVIAFHLD